MIDLLVIGNHSKPTGFARVLNALCDSLSQYLKIVQIDIDSERSYQRDNRYVVGNLKLSDYFGLEAIDLAILKYRPQAILTCHDCWFMEAILPVLRRHKVLKNTFYYCPIDMSSIISVHFNTLTSLPNIVFYNDYAINCYKQELKQQDKVINQRLKIIGHGVEKSIFYKQRETKKSIRRRLFPGHERTWEAFLFLNCNRNTYRKRLDHTIEAFSLYKKAYDSTAILIILGEQFGGTFDILGMAEEFGLKDDILFLNKDQLQTHLDDKYIANLYNAVDVCINTAEQEGWGLIPFEAAACGICPILHATPIQMEIWDDNALIIESDMEDSEKFDHHKWVEAFHRLSIDKNFYNKISNRAYQYATSTTFDWDNIALQWVDFIALSLPDRDIIRRFS